MLSDCYGQLIFVFTRLLNIFQNTFECVIVYDVIYHLITFRRILDYPHPRYQSRPTALLKILSIEEKIDTVISYQVNNHIIVLN